MPLSIYSTIIEKFFLNIYNTYIFNGNTYEKKSLIRFWL